ncbi:hypothetical protein COO91_08609 [Nostoc flagelliforme CCNUN1]|uniref:Uncharacterized protein n=1 Tax=Nostoc flagelliforme CCNUN1 TaxID=2038116 RepID=A0A2K8T451_9NOSO|nr:hypothetical protein [Nostoc flagelliforme]AUB42477.1 hypothetical protein COO91_08609 [Nostoc flagelliforme CCNUN1]
MPAAGVVIATHRTSPTPYQQSQYVAALSTIEVIPSLSSREAIAVPYERSL